MQNYDKVAFCARVCINKRINQTIRKQLNWQLFFLLKHGRTFFEMLKQSTVENVATVFNYRFTTFIFIGFYEIHPISKYALSCVKNDLFPVIFFPCQRNRNLCKSTLNHREQHTECNECHCHWMSHQQMFLVVIIGLIIRWLFRESMFPAVFLFKRLMFNATRSMIDGVANFASYYFVVC